MISTIRGCLLREGDFVRSALERGGKQASQERSSGITFYVVANRVAAHVGMRMEMLKRPGKSTARGARGRSLLAYLGVMVLKKKMVEIAEYFGISQPAVSRLYQRGEAWAKENKAAWRSIVS